MSKNTRNLAKERNTTILKDRGISFTSHNNGLHLIIENKWDFWPSTGKYRERPPLQGSVPLAGRGVNTLINYLPKNPYPEIKPAAGPKWNIDFDAMVVDPKWGLDIQEKATLLSRYVEEKREHEIIKHFSALSGVDGLRRLKAVIESAIENILNRGSEKSEPKAN